jgi:hypothetical protein
MDPNADCNNEQEGPGGVTETMPSQWNASVATPGLAGHASAHQADRLRERINDYSHFARQFRRRFGHPPGAHGEF